MRDPKRIDKFCQRLGEVWKKVPDMRFGQLMINILGSLPKDPWLYEENEMIGLIEDWGRKNGVVKTTRKKHERGVGKE